MSGILWSYNILFPPLYLPDLACRWWCSVSGRGIYRSSLFPLNGLSREGSARSSSMVDCWLKKVLNPFRLIFAYCFWELTQVHARELVPASRSHLPLRCSDVLLSTGSSFPVNSAKSPPPFCRHLFRTISRLIAESPSEICLLLQVPNPLPRPSWGSDESHSVMENRTGR